MYICDRCGEVCSEDELPTYSEDFGYDTGVGWCSCPQTMVDSCSCGGQFVEAKECDNCGGYAASDELYGGVCEGCIEDEATLENAIEYGKEDETAVELNGFLAFCFTKEQIEEILIEYLKNSNTPPIYSANDDAKKYCHQDRECFGEWLIRKDTTH